MLFFTYLYVADSHVFCILLVYSVRIGEKCRFMIINLTRMVHEKQTHLKPNLIGRRKKSKFPLKDEENCKKKEGFFIILLVTLTHGETKTSRKRR